ncbi:MAG: ketopantoate reductase family protein [Candidatus Nealsonbacteria bacterium]
MNKIKIIIIGIGGRTGTMFAHELENFANVLGVGKETDIEIIKQKKLFVQKKDKKPELFNVKVIKDTDFKADLTPDIIFLATKNPVTPVIKYYFEKFKGKKIPDLFLSQNGIKALEDSKKALEEIFKEQASKIKIIRCVLFNPIDQKKNNNTYIKYSLPIRLAISKAQGQTDIKGLIEIFRSAGFKVKEFPQKHTKNLEFSKLFLNLIGMASASHNLSVKDGFKNKEIFKEELRALKEYIEVVKKSNGKFLNFSNYPVKLLSALFSLMPEFVLVVFRNVLANIISKGRTGKLKDLDEIDYYNGGVVRLGKEVRIETPVNKKVCKRILEKLNRV